MTELGTALSPTALGCAWAANKLLGVIYGSWFSSFSRLVNQMPPPFSATPAGGFRLIPAGSMDNSA